MGWFSRRKQEVKEPVVSEPIPCRHKWKDFKWYIDVKRKSEMGYYTVMDCFTVDIYEPYVCVCCKERKDVKLSSQTFLKVDAARKYFEDITKRYADHLGDKALIEDEINDMQLVDREYIEAYEKLLRMKNNPPITIETSTSN